MGKSSIIAPYYILKYILTETTNPSNITSKSLCVMTTDVLLTDMYREFISKFYEVLRVINVKRKAQNMVPFSVIKIDGLND